ncbi:MAG: Gfo/Idh/MocA family protein [Phycisphaeraceae bacterium]
MSRKRTRYAVVGTGGRARMFVNPIVTDYADEAELVGLCDPNPQRIAYWNETLREQFGHDAVPAYDIADFDKMLKEQKVDTVIVTTVDAFHHEYVIRAMEQGCDAITEKPMTIDDEKCRAIVDAVERTGRKLRVAFNYRWAPGNTLVRKLLQHDRVIGDIIHVDMEYLLNTSHGADYFRRWHREKDKSGGLMVHKSTHHFDLVNWWLDAVPESVFGFGKLAFYGRENAKQRGVEVKYDRYTGHDTTGDPFALKLDADEHVRKLYLEAEKHDGYQRDRNVFGDNISIEDTMSVLVKYRTGAVLNYSLNAYLPREGFYVVFNGTQGRLEFQEVEAAHYVDENGSARGKPETFWETRIVVHPMFGRPYEVDIPRATGGHGGGDPKLVEQIFSHNPPDDPWHRSAAHGQGAASILIGIGANHSFTTGEPVCIDKLCPKLGKASQLHELP